MPWHPGAGAGCSEQRPGRTVALGYIHTYILGGRYRDAVVWRTVLPRFFPSLAHLPWLAAVRIISPRKLMMSG